ncbi:MAG: DUF1615 family protein [Myxococcaceae bacterium]|nr:DUF1615 family protein [Myxococcaceae bacterium]
MSSFASRLLIPALCALWAAGCTRQVRPTEPSTPRLTPEEATALVPESVPDREGWALDTLNALDRNHLPADLPSVCAVFAVVEQESNYHANPVVPDLARIVRRRLESYAEKLGPLGATALEQLLQARARGSKATFGERLRQVRTERDLDLVFRDLIRYSKEEHPILFGAADLASELTGRGSLSQLNPITTAGSMQVSVRFSVEYAARQSGDGEADEWVVRDRLYTRAGGLYLGSARLLGYDAGYDAPVYRFADYNAGFYASRNAAVQDALSQLTGRPLVPDGDLLAYDEDGDARDEPSNTEKALRLFTARYATWISDGHLRADLLQEKSHGFEETDTYRALAATWLKKTGRPLPYARLPEVAIVSPKMKSKRTTKWFAQSVLRRYEACLRRAR